VGDEGFRFDYRLLESEIKQIVKEKLQDEDAAMFDIRQDSQRCPTFVVASSATAVDGSPQLLRSYHGGAFNGANCYIWEAARATTALPLFFKPINIDLENQSELLIGGGLAHKNPGELALDEAHWLWPEIKSFHLISVGTGKQNPLPVINEEDPTRRRASLGGWIPGVEIVRNRLYGLSAVRQIQKVHARLSGDPEGPHRRMMRWGLLPDNRYYRFNVEDGVEGIGVVEWRRMEEIVGHTLRYLEKGEVNKRIELCAGDITG